jgi:hypothetical protein
MSTTSDYKKGKSNQVKIYMFRGSNYKKGDPNLADDRSFLIGGRWPRFLPNFSDNHLPHLDLGSGAAISEDRFRLGVNFEVLGWIRMIPFDGEVHFCQKGPRGQPAKTGRWSHHRSWAPDHLPATERANEIRKGFERNQEENIGLMVIPLPQGLHTLRESAIALAPMLFGNMSFPHRLPVLEVDGRRSE